MRACPVRPKGWAWAWPGRCSSNTAPRSSGNVSSGVPSPARSPGASCSASQPPGSDLAGLTTRAERDGDEWLRDGQKVWTTGAAHHADFGLLLARTDWDVPKHRGITCFVVPMRRAGVEVRPLRQMNGHASFNEVFLDGHRPRSTTSIGRSRAAAGRWRCRSSPTSGVWPRPAGPAPPEAGGGRAGLAGGHRRARPRPRAPHVVPAASGPAGPGHRAGDRARPGGRSAGPPGDGPGGGAGPVGAVDSAGRAAAARGVGPAARAGRLAGQAGQQRHRPAGSAGTCADRRRRTACWPGPARRGRDDRRDFPVRAGHVHRRRYRPDPADDPRRADPRPAQGARPQPESALPRGARWLIWTETAPASTTRPSGHRTVPRRSFSPTASPHRRRCGGRTSRRSPPPGRSSPGTCAATAAATHRTTWRATRPKPAWRTWPRCSTRAGWRAWWRAGCPSAGSCRWSSGWRTRTGSPGWCRVAPARAIVGTRRGSGGTTGPSRSPSAWSATRHAGWRSPPAAYSPSAMRA